MSKYYPFILSIQPHINKKPFLGCTANKVALRLLNGLEYTHGTIEFLTYCCDFHGCGNYNFHKNCVALFKAGGMHVIGMTLMSMLIVVILVFGHQRNGR